MTTNLLVPFSTANQQILGRQGQNYTSDAYGMIACLRKDILDMLAVGCTYPQGDVNVRDNLSASTDPSVSNDNSQDYGAGSRWLNTTAGRSWICLSAGTGAAVWVLEGGPTKNGTNLFGGTFIANGTSAVTVANTAIAITDMISISLNTVGGTVGAIPHVATITAGTGFTVVGTASDTSTYNWTRTPSAA